MRLIDREALLDAMPKNDELLSLDVRRIILAQPTVDANPVRHGRWERDNTRQKSYRRLCTACGKVAYHCGVNRDYSYCPNCGAEMYAKEAEHGQES